jgi:hypothetical protein
MMEFLQLVEVPQVEYRLLHNFFGDVLRITERCSA